MNDFNFYRSFMAKNIPVERKEEDLRKESIKLYNKRVEEEDRLLELYEQKKLHNKNTIKKAQAIKAKRAAAKKEDK